MKWPFILNPANWFLTGNERQKAIAKHTLEGYALDRRLLLIENNGEPLTELQSLKLRHDHGKITDYEYDVKKVKLGTYANPVEQDLLLLEVEHKHEKIDDNTFNKSQATLLNKPWVGIVNNGFDGSLGTNGLTIELDWNQQWIAFLKENGYAGYTEEQIIEQWFADVCAETVETTEPPSFNTGYDKGQ